MNHILQLGELEFFASAITAPASVEPFDNRYGVFLNVERRAKLVALFPLEPQAVAECMRINKWIAQHCKLSDTEEARPIESLQFDEDDSDGSKH